MNNLTVPIRNLPRGTNIISQSAGWTTTIRPNDTYTEKAVLDVCGVEVMLICYDRNISKVMVYIGGSPSSAIMPLDCVGSYVSGRVRR